jgi:uncharacterized protein (TIGR02996 family)
VVARVRARDRAQLLAAVLADPANLAARAIYADALQEAGDPRGEFIALQLGRRRTRRERELLVAHREAWLGSIAGVLAESSQFANGFVRVAALAAKRVAMTPQQLAHDEWATVERLDALAVRTTPRLHAEVGELVARLPRLRELVVDARWLLPLVAARVPAHALVRLEVLLPGVEALLAVLRGGQFPQLRTLRVWGEDPGPDLLVQIASARPLDEFDCALSGRPARAAIAIGKLSRAVPVLFATGAWGKIRITRAGEKLAIAPVEVTRRARAPGGSLHVLVTALGRERVMVRRM